MNMKKLTFLAVMLVCSLTAFSQVKRVAILEVVDTEGKLTYAQKLMLRSGLTQAIADTPGYEAYSRSDMDAIMSEQDFQRTGNVSKDQIQRLGEMTGAEYILKTEAIITHEKTLFGKTAPQLYVTAQIIVVETSQVDLIRYHTMWAETDKILQGCKELTVKLFGSPTAESTIVERPQPAPVVQQPVAVVEEDIVYSKKELTPALIRTGKEYSYNGQYLTKREYENLLRNTCPEAYSQYKKGNTLVKTGWGLFGAGFVLIGGGITLATIGSAIYSENQGTFSTEPDFLEQYENGKDGYYIFEGNFVRTEEQNRLCEKGDAIAGTGTAILSVGCGGLVTSIPLLSVGYTKRNKRALDTFNRKCAEPAVTYNLTAGQNSIGLAINF